jgi:DNA-binding Lrp family transcriptional regulator
MESLKSEISLYSPKYISKKVEKMLAYILLGVQPNTEDKVYVKLKKLKEVRLVNLLFGSWDVVAQVEVANTAALNEFMLDKIRKITEVSMSATMIVAK